MRTLFAFTLCLTLLACTKPASFRTENPQTFQIDAIPADFKMPAGVWELIEKQADEKSAEAASPPGIFYSSVKLFLTEKNPKILRAPSIVIDLPRGGGLVDLADYLTGEQGSFYVGFELPEEFQDGQNIRAIYLSRARKRKLDHRVYGAGCNQYLDITPKFLEMMKSEGLKVNTSRQRHVTVLGGHFIFSVMKDNRIYITQVTLTDSRHRNLFCEAQ